GALVTRRSSMPDQVKPQETSLPPHAQLVQMATAYWVSSIVHAAAKLDLADRLASGPLSAAEIAGAAGLYAPALYRLMRSLAGLGILTEREDQRFALTPLGAALKSDAPGHARATILTFCNPWFAQSMADLPYSVHTGKTAFERNTGMPVFDFLGQHPEDASL